MILVAHFILLLDGSSLINLFLKRLSSPLGPARCWLFHSPVTQTNFPTWQICFLSSFWVLSSSRTLKVDDQEEEFIVS